MKGRIGEAGEYKYIRSRGRKEEEKGEKRRKKMKKGIYERGGGLNRIEQWIDRWILVRGESLE